jgi:hypothetical protein
MRKVIVIACLIAVTLNGCAARRAEVLPPDTDPNQLAATIAQRGQEVPHEALPPSPEPAAADKALDKAARVAVVVAVVGGVCLIAVPLIILCAKGHGHPHWSLPAIPAIHLDPRPPEPDDRREAK